MQYPGGFSMNQRRKRLAMAPEDVVKNTFEATTYIAENQHVENMMVPRQHKKTRFPFLRENRVNDEFHSDTFFPTVQSNQGHTCSQMFLGKNTDFMYVHQIH